MKILKLIIYFISLTSFILLQDCKENAVVQPPPNNNQTSAGPVLTSPPNETTTQILAPLLDWNDFNGAVSYHMMASLDANFAGTIVLDSTGITTSQFQIPAALLETGIYYYWRVEANISGGTSPWSSAWRFRVILAPPAAPTLISPQNGAINQPFLPFFDWNDVATAQFYKLQISPNSNFSIINLDTSGIITSQLQCPLFILNTGTQYYWRVNASNSNGVSIGPYSSVFSFTTISGPTPNSISGQITFVDTNFIYPTQFRYYVGAYTSWPPTSFGPVSIDTINIQKIGNVYYGNYKMKNLPSGNYIISDVYYQLTILSAPVLGIYGCDTAHVQFSGCPSNPNTVSITNNNGLENINYLSWADTTHRIY